MAYHSIPHIFARGEQLDPSDEVRIYRWMTVDLGLTGSSAIIYALIYRESMNGEDIYCSPGVYLTKWTNIEDHQVRKLLRKLEKNGLIFRIRTDNPYSYYKVNFEKIPEEYRTVVSKEQYKLHPKAQYSPYFSVFGWMLNETDLTSRKLELFAFIADQCVEDEWYEGVIAQITDIVGISNNSIMKRFSDLTKLSYLDKEKSFQSFGNGTCVSRCRYRVYEYYRKYLSIKLEEKSAYSGLESKRLKNGFMVREIEKNKPDDTLPGHKEWKNEHKKTGRGKRAWKRITPQNDPAFQSEIKKRLGNKLERKYLSRIVGTDVADTGILALTNLYTGVEQTKNKASLLPDTEIKKYIAHSSRKTVQRVLLNAASRLKRGLIHELYAYLVTAFSHADAWGLPRRRLHWKPVVA